MVAALLALASPAAAQKGDPPTRSTLEGVYNAEQAARGEALFRDTCTACHAPGYFKATAFGQAWSGRPIYWLYKTIRTTMPESSPGSLKTREVADLLAYILSINAYPEGPDPLPADEDALRHVVWEAHPETAPKEP